jgi:hypothetical protein
MNHEIFHFNKWMFGIHFWFKIYINII